MRPPMTAGPIDRARRPPNADESSFTTSSAAARGSAIRERIAKALRKRGSLLLCRWSRFGLLRRHPERVVGDGRIQLDLLDRDRLSAGRALRLRLDGRREEDAVEFLIVADGRFAFDFLALHFSLRFDSHREE